MWPWSSHGSSGSRCADERLLPAGLRVVRGARGRQLARVGGRGVEGAIEGGFWAERRRINREVMIPDGRERLAAAGNFDNLRAAANGGDYKGRVYQDSDLYKWLEAVAWELRTEPSPALQRMADETTT